MGRLFVVTMGQLKELEVTEPMVNACYLSLCVNILFLYPLCVAQWKVHVRRPGVIALQNQHTPAHWLAIRDGATIGYVCFMIFPL